MQLAQHYRTTRQPGRMSGEGMEGQRLVFLYPFAVDTTLGKYANLCRDFFTVSFINEIKIDNVLNIISTANQNVGSIGSGNNQINPAELIYKVSKGHLDRDANRDADRHETRPEQDPYYYKEKIEKLNDYLQHQLKHDPRFQRFRPVFSTITINQLLDIPLIIGTNSYQISNEYMYLLMMVSIIYGITWNDESDIRKANTIISDLAKNPGSLAKLMISDENRHKFELQANLKTASNNKLLNQDDYTGQAAARIKQFINSESDLSKILFGLVFNRNKWDANFPEMTRSNANITFNSISIDTTRTQQRHYEKSIHTLANYLSEYIVPTLHRLNIFTGPTDPSRNVPEKINSFIDNLLTGLSDDFLNLSTNINQGLININSTSSNLTQASNNIEQMRGLCEENVSLGAQANKLLQEFSNKTRIDISFDMQQLMKFVNEMSTYGNQFKTLSATVDSWMTFLAQTGKSQLLHKLKEIQSKIDKHISELLYSQYPAGSGHGPWIDIGQVASNPDSFPDIFANYSSVAGISNGSHSTRELQKHSDYFRQFLADIETSIREITSFFVKWVFFSYSCDYLKDVEIDVEIQKRDALEFPNFCLVIPFRLFRDLYITQVNKNFKSYLTDTNISYDTFRRQELAYNFNDIKGVFRIVTQQLKIPNLIVIDEKTNKCHYQFMYMTRPISINFATMENFIKHQQDVLPGF